MSSGRFTLRGFASQGLRAAGRSLAGGGGGASRIWPITQPRYVAMFTGMRYGVFERSEPDFLHGMLELRSYLRGDVLIVSHVGGTVVTSVGLRGIVEVNP